MSAYIEDVTYCEAFHALNLNVVVNGYRATATVILQHPDSITVASSGTPARAEHVRHFVRHVLSR